MPKTKETAATRKAKARREMIRSLMIQGFRSEEIPEILERSGKGIVSKTYKKDLKWIEENPIVVDEFDFQGHLALRKAQFQDWIRRLNITYNQGTPAQRIKAAAVILKIMENEDTLYMRAGFFPKARQGENTPEIEEFYQEIGGLFDTILTWAHKNFGGKITTDEWDRAVFEFKSIIETFGQEHPDEEVAPDADDLGIQDKGSDKYEWSDSKTTAGGTPPYIESGKENTTSEDPESDGEAVDPDRARELLG